VALQGTLETFALPDVLRLLASTKKTGRLHLTGSHGSGSVWLADGEIVSSEATHEPMAAAASEVVFELLRFKEGEFVFDADASAPEAGPPADVEETLASAESMLEEWKTIEAVVPSLAGWVSLVPELPGSEITIDGQRWSQLVAVGGGITVGGLGERLSLGELPASRTVKELLELGLVSLADAPDGAPAFVDTTPTPVSFEPTPIAPDPIESISFEAAGAAPDAPFLSVVDDPPSGLGSFDPGALVIEPPSFGASLTDPAPDQTAAAPQSDEDDLTDAAEIARQLANLSPKAARAVAAAAKATTEEEREAALAEVDDDDEPINRGLLLKFLGSVNG
jgi:Domain of unknown function (DUF4388)